MRDGILYNVKQLHFVNFPFWKRTEYDRDVADACGGSTNAGLIAIPRPTGGMNCGALCWFTPLPCPIDGVVVGAHCTPFGWLPCPPAGVGNVLAKDDMSR